MSPNYILVTSSQDPAGVTMSNYLKVIGFSSDGYQKDDKGESFSYSKGVMLYVANASSLTLENLDDAYPEAGAFVFLSKHRSNSGIPTLTSHCTGNFEDAPFGGKPEEIAISFPSLQKAYQKAITGAKSYVPSYDVTIEATHHGPTSLNKPVLFVELGSSEQQWEDTNAASTICNCLLDILDRPLEVCKKVGVAIGGTHYPSKFNKLLLESEFGLAAIASKHNLQAIDEIMLTQMIEKSVEKVTHIILDSKGLGRYKGSILRMAEKTGLEILKV